MDTKITQQRDKRRRAHGTCKRRLRRCLLLVFMIQGLSLAGGAQSPVNMHPQTGTGIDTGTSILHNPVLKGFYPDPSIIRVGRPQDAGADYYLVNSTFSYFPGIPVFHSRDMVHWTQIGNVITRPAQMNFLGAGVSRGLFAPSISFYDGVFYLVCTQVDTGGNFVVTAKDPAGPWSDPVFLPQVQGIDPSLYFDPGTGKAYIVYNGEPDGQPLYSGHRTIRLYSFDYRHLNVTGQSKVIINGGVDITKEPKWIEGPHLIQRKGWYYLYAAEGGTSVQHSEVVFRSASVEGPFVPYKDNPILTQRDLPEGRPAAITSAGHAQLVEGPDGHTYAFFLAVRPYEKDYYNTGRETFVAPVEWKDGWPVVQTGKGGVQYQYRAAFASTDKSKGIPLSGNFTLTDRFDGPLDLSYLFLRTVDSSDFKTRAENGAGLLLKLKPETVMGNQHPAFIGRRQQHLYGSYTVALDFTTQKSNEKAGVVIFQNEHHFYYACKSVSGTTGRPVVQLYDADPSGKGMRLLAEKSLPADSNLAQNPSAETVLKIVMDGAYYRFLYRAPGDKQWLPLKDAADARPLSTHHAGGFTGCILGLYATSCGQATSGSVRYLWTTYTGADKTDR